MVRLGAGGPLAAAPPPKGLLMAVTVSVSPAHRAAAPAAPRPRGRRRGVGMGGRHARAGLPQAPGGLRAALGGRVRERVGGARGSFLSRGRRPGTPPPMPPWPPAPPPWAPAPPAPA